jgi:S1-C subfamily serine protease
MKKGFTVLACVLTMIFLTKIVSGQDYSTIHFLAYYDNKKADNYNCKWYINDRLAVSARLMEEADVKVFSEGRLSLTYLDGVYPRNLNLDVRTNNDYYVLYKVYTGKFLAIDSAEWFKDYKPKVRNLISIEEDIQQPWGKVDKAKASGKGQGTCFVLSSLGFLITNYHVIENAKDITVKGIDGDFTTKYGASVVGSDPSNDLALLKIGNKNIKFATPPYAFRSSGVAQAEKVYALGFPAAEAMGQEVKITEGIISSKSGVGNDLSKFQISAAVNHGNSGGPLIDDQGNVIGVIFAKSTIAESAGYAVKASYLETFLKNVDGFEFPNLTNTIKDKPLTDKVSELKNFIFIVETN